MIRNGSSEWSHWITCDWCGVDGPQGWTLMSAVELTLADGWQVSDPDLCPSCKARHAAAREAAFQASFERVRQQYPHIIAGLGDKIEGI